MVPGADRACELDLDCFNASETGLCEQLKFALVALLRLYDRPQEIS